eukprot:343770-Lingulodinium_polyedra.AAC.1
MLPPAFQNGQDQRGPLPAARRHRHNVSIELVRHWQDLLGAFVVVRNAGRFALCHYARGRDGGLVQSARGA